MSQEPPQEPRPDDQSTTEQAAEVQTGPADSSIQPYDFRRPERFSKDQLRALRFLQDRFARQLSTSIAAYLRTSSDVQVFRVEELTYGDFLASLPETTAIFALDFQPVSGTGAIEMDLDAAFACVHSMLSGRGKSTVEARALTDIEQSILGKILNLIVDVHTKEWQSLSPVKFAASVIDSKTQMQNLADPSEIFAVTTFDLQVAESTGRMRTALPASALEKMGLRAADAARGRPLEQAPAGPRAAYYRRLASVPFPVTASSDAAISAREVLALVPGDVMSLGADTNHAVELRIADASKFLGQLRVQNGQLEIGIEKAIDAI